MSRRLFVDCGFDVKAIGDDGHIEGLGAVFGNIDLGFDRIEQGAFADSIKSVSAVPMLWQHAHDEPIGLWESLSETRRGLKVTGQINLDTQRGREARALTKQGAVQGLSIGYIPKDFEFEDEVRVLKRDNLRERDDEIVVRQRGDGYALGRVKVVSQGNPRGIDLVMEQA